MITDQNITYNQGGQAKISHLRMIATEQGDISGEARSVDQGYDLNRTEIFSGAKGVNSFWQDEFVKLFFVVLAKKILIAIIVMNFVDRT